MSFLRSICRVVVSMAVVGSVVVSVESVNPLLDSLKQKASGIEHTLNEEAAATSILQTNSQSQTSDIGVKIGGYTYSVAELGAMVTLKILEKRPPPDCGAAYYGNNRYKSPFVECKEFVNAARTLKNSPLNICYNKGSVFYDNVHSGIAWDMWNCAQLVLGSHFGMCRCDRAKYPKLLPYAKVGKGYACTVNIADDKANDQWAKWWRGTADKTGTNDWYGTDCFRSRTDYCLVNKSKGYANIVAPNNNNQPYNANAVVTYCAAAAECSSSVCSNLAKNMAYWDSWWCVGQWARGAANSFGPGANPVDVISVMGDEGPKC